MAKNRALKCSQLVRNIPLERYRLPDDGRKWKQAARSRSAFLGRLATYANGDGTFVRDSRNYSPSLKTLLKHVAHGSYYKLTEELKALGLLSWTREKHYDRRVYTIHLPEQVQDSSENRSNIEDESGPTFKDERQEQVQHSQNQVQHSQITGPTSGQHPSFPSKEPSIEREPSSPQQNPSRSLNAKDSTKSSGQEHAVDRAVQYVIERAKTLSSGKAQFSMKAIDKLRDALLELGKFNAQEIDEAIQAKLDLCTDEISYVIFGSSLAADLVASVRSRRQCKANAARARQDNQWYEDFLEQHDNPEIETWLASHPVPPQFAASVPLWLAEAKRNQADKARRAAEAAEPDPTAEELFGTQ